VEEAIESAQRTDTVIHVLLVADRGNGGNGGCAAPADDTGGTGDLREFREKTGRSVRPDFEDPQSSTRWLLPDQQQSRRQFRTIKLDVDNHDSKSLARKGYYGPQGLAGAFIDFLHTSGNSRPLESGRYGFLLTDLTESWLLG